MTSSDTPSSEHERWIRHWFPVAFSIDLPEGSISAVSVFGKRFVVFRDEHGAVASAVDHCPHRGARLSNGRLVGGEFECLYHGWRFGADGGCRHIPQLEVDSAIPPRAALTTLPALELEGIVWIWPGDPEGARPERIPTIPLSVRQGVHRIDFSIDLPYGQDYLIENVLDLAHIHVAHDGVRGGGRRAHAGPLTFDLDDRGAGGFFAELVKSSETSELSGASVEFRAPNLVHYVSQFDEPDACAGLALYSVPLDAGRCRLLYRAYGNRWPREDLRRPRWREHLHQCLLLEQDMAVVAGQAFDIDRSEKLLAETWLPIRSSDALVLAVRRWIDDHALGRPGSVGLRNQGLKGVVPPLQRVDRWTLHVRQCVDCTRALARLQRAKSQLEWVTLVGLILTALVPLPWAVMPASGVLVTRIGARRVRRWIGELTKGLSMEEAGNGLGPATGSRVVN